MIHPIPVLQILQIYILQMAKHNKFTQYLAIITMETSKITTNLKKMQKWPYIAQVISL